VTVALFEDWFINCLIPKVEKYCRGNNINFRILLVMNNAAGHPALVDNFYSSAEVWFFP
jgi:hypothetical protein